MGNYSKKGKPHKTYTANSFKDAHKQTKRQQSERYTAIHNNIEDFFCFFFKLIA